MNNITANRNFLSPVGWKLTIDSDKYVNTIFFSTSVGLPSVSCPEVATNFRNEQGFMPGDHVAYDQLSIKFLVDEDMVNYQEMLNWIVENSKSAGGKPIMHDLILSVLTGKNNSNKMVRFHNAFPISLSGFEFSTQIADIEYITCEVGFRYSHFDFIK